MSHPAVRRTDQTVTYRVNCSFLIDSSPWSLRVLFHWLCIYKCPSSLRCALRCDVECGSYRSAHSCPLIRFHSFSFCLCICCFRRQYRYCCISDWSVMTVSFNPFSWSAIDRARRLWVCTQSDAVWFKLLSLCTRSKVASSKHFLNMWHKNLRMKGSYHPTVRTEFYIIL